MLESQTLIGVRSDLNRNHGPLNCPPTLPYTLNCQPTLPSTLNCQPTLPCTLNCHHTPSLLIGVGELGPVASNDSYDAVSEPRRNEPSSTNDLFSEEHSIVINNRHAVMDSEHAKITKFHKPLFQLLSWNPSGISTELEAIVLNDSLNIYNWDIACIGSSTVAYLRKRMTSVSIVYMCFQG